VRQGPKRFISGRKRRKAFINTLNSKADGLFPIIYTGHKGSDILKNGCKRWKAKGLTVDEEKSGTFGGLLFDT